MSDSERHHVVSPAHVCVYMCVFVIYKARKEIVSGEEEVLRKVGNKEGNGQYAEGEQKQGLTEKWMEVGVGGERGAELMRTKYDTYEQAMLELCMLT